jgi:hypothetical protein
MGKRRKDWWQEKLRSAQKKRTRPEQIALQLAATLLAICMAVAIALLSR